MKLLTKEKIFKAKDRPTEDVPVPEWGGTVRVRTLSGSERDAFEESIVETRKGERKVKMQNARAKLVALACIDKDGQLLFSANDVRELGQKSSKALDRVFIAASKLSGISDDDVEELVKNSETGPADGPTSD